MKKRALILIIVLLAIAAQTPPDEIHPYTINGLRERDYPGGEINTRWVMEQYADFTQSYIDYPSDGLTITGVMNVPTGEGPFPVVILLHGFYNRDGYWSGLGTSQEATYFARHGYLTLAPDFRSWGQSESGLNLFATGLTIDTLNLVSSLSSLPQADVSRIYLFGHSMGGGVATKTLLVDDRIAAAVLYAPNSANDADLIERWGPACLPGQSEAAGDKCNPAEVLPPEAPQSLQDAYFAAAYDPQAMQRIASIYHLEYITAPVQIHIGTADGAQLEQTPPEWSEYLYTALLAAGKDAEYFIYPGQGHFIGGQDWVSMMERAISLFEAK